MLVKGGIFLSANKLKLKSKRSPLPFRYAILISLLVFIFATALGLWLVNEGIKPTLMSYAENQTKKISTLVINRAVTEKIARVRDINEILTVEPNDTSGKSTKFNTEIINRIVTDTTTIIQEQLRAIEKGEMNASDLPDEIAGEIKNSNNNKGIIYSIPLGQATNNALLGNLGPKVPIRFHAIGGVRPTIHSKVEPFGINNAYVEVILQIEVTVQIIVPFATKQQIVKRNIPIAMGIIQGDVPQFYNKNSDTTPSIDTISQ